MKNNAHNMCVWYKGLQEVLKYKNLKIKLKVILIKWKKFKYKRRKLGVLQWKS